MTVHPQRIHEQAINIITALWGTNYADVQRRMTRLLETLPIHDGQPGIVDHYEQAWNNSRHPLPKQTAHGKSSGHSDPTATTVLQHQTTRRRLDHAAKRLDQAVAETHGALTYTHKANPDPEPYIPAGTTWHRNTRLSPEAEQAIARRETRKTHPLDTPT